MIGFHLEDGARLPPHFQVYRNPTMGATYMAEKSAANEAAARQLAEERKLLARSHEEYAMRMKGRPTPSQEENDLAALGAHFAEHEPDGADPDPFLQPTPVAKQLEPAKPGGGYQTRQVTAKQQPAAPPVPPTTHQG
jgi:hypothetical protein